MPNLSKPKYRALLVGDNYINKIVYKLTRSCCVIYIFTPLMINSNAIYIYFHYYVVLLNLHFTNLMFWCWNLRNICNSNVGLLMGTCCIFRQWHTCGKHTIIVVYERNVSESSSKRGPKRRFTDSERKHRKRESNAKLSNLSRIWIGDQCDRWNELQNNLVL
jgi:hypothetical protein